MARLARVKVEDSGCFYHLCGRTAGFSGHYPLDNKRCRRQLIEFIKFYAQVYCCQVLGFCIMGNHYHLVVYMEEPREMTRAELFGRAKLLYNETLLKGWLKANWERFQNRIFDVSELMRSLQSHIARWFNRAHDRRGRFWADRFKSVVLEDYKAALDCLLYVELNPVRAGLVERPELFEGSSLYFREIKNDRWMMSLTDIVGSQSRAIAMRDYKGMVYFRGSVPTKGNHATISQRLLKQEADRGFKSEGVFSRRVKHLTEGVVIGSEEFVRAKLEHLKSLGQYLRRKDPIPQLEKAHHCLRPQREES